VSEWVAAAIGFAAILSTIPLAAALGAALDWWHHFKTRRERLEADSEECVRLINEP
jgi:hypothetical protein